jgi:hypothetical protein
MVLTMAIALLKTSCQLQSFFSELQSNLASGGKILTAEPKMHVSTEGFQKTLKIAQSTGLRLCGQPAIRFSLTALFESM